jgi:hypothetical protein
VSSCLAAIVYSCLSRICRLATDVFLLFVSRPLPSNESIRHNILGASSAKPEGCSVRISAGIPTIPIELFRSFPQTLQSNTRLVPQLGHDRPFLYSLQFYGHSTDSVMKQATNPDPPRARHAARGLWAASEHTSRNYIT